MSDEPHAPARNKSIELANGAPRCGARRKTDGQPCRQPAMRNGRCKQHGGMSTGPRTPEGLERSRRARWKHGFYSAESRNTRREARDLIRSILAVIRET